MPIFCKSALIFAPSPKHREKSGIIYFIYIFSPEYIELFMIIDINILSIYQAIELLFKRVPFWEFPF